MHADVFGLVAVDGVVEGGLGDAGKEDGELGYDFVGGGEVFEAFFAGGVGIAHEVAAVTWAQSHSTMRGSSVRRTISRMRSRGLREPEPVEDCS